MKVLKPAFKALLALLVVLSIVVGAYLAYVVLTYRRIEDNTPLAVDALRLEVHYYGQFTLSRIASVLVAQV